MRKPQDTKTNQITYVASLASAKGGVVAATAERRVSVGTGLGAVARNVARLAARVADGTAIVVARAAKVALNRRVVRAVASL